MLASIKNQISKQTQTVIGPNTVLKGDLRFSGLLRLEGHVFGDVIATSDSARAELAISSIVQGSVEVPTAVVHGAIQGNLVCAKKVSVKSSARVDGDVRYNRRIDIANGAEIRGEQVYVEDESSK